MKNVGNDSFTRMLTIVMCCLLTVAGPWVIASQLRHASRSRGNSKWPAAKGIITDSRLIPTTRQIGGKRRRVYRSSLRYRFSVDGREYAGHRYSFDLSKSTRGNSIAQSYPVGREVKVYYDPRNPQNCVLNKGESRAEIHWMNMAIGVFFWIGGWAFVAGVIYRKAKRISPPGTRDSNAPRETKSAWHLPQFSTKTIRTAIFSRAGIITLFVIGLLYVYGHVNRLPPVIQELRERGNVVNFAEEDGDLDVGNRPALVWQDSQIHMLRLFVVEDLSPLAKHAPKMSNLKTLNLRETEASDLGSLAELTSLETLDLRETLVADVAPLANLHNLNRLDLYSTQVADLTSLASLTNLESIDLGATQVSDLTPLAQLVKLEVLRIDHSQVSDLSPLAKMDRLSWLQLDESQVRGNLSTLAILTKLRTLDVRETNLSDRELAELQGMLSNGRVLSGRAASR